MITRQGFQFLLMETGAQVWYFLLQYLDTCQYHGLSQVECLTFLLQLGFSKLGSVGRGDGEGGGGPVVGYMA